MEPRREPPPRPPAGPPALRGGRNHVEPSQRLVPRASPSNSLVRRQTIPSPATGGGASNSLVRRQTIPAKRGRCPEGAEGASISEHRELLFHVKHFGRPGGGRAHAGVGHRDAARVSPRPPAGPPPLRGGRIRVEPSQRLVPRASPSNSLVRRQTILPCKAGEVPRRGGGGLYLGTSGTFVSRETFWAPGRWKSTRKSATETRRQPPPRPPAGPPRSAEGGTTSSHLIVCPVSQPTEQSGPATNDPPPAKRVGNFCFT